MFKIYLLLLFSATLFFLSFFPITSPNLKINNDLPTHIKNISFNENYKTNITKTILVVIDALRWDFVNTNYMPLTSKLMKNNGCFNTIKVETPTVTLPRIKALTIGNIPQFMDIVLNLAHTEILSDNLIHSAVKRDKKMVFYGDDTWLKLFPNAFSRFEGTTSFFVRDFVEVDANVTRNVYVELDKNDWDIMILHYLGLDHIGHVFGPFSSLIPTKLDEMDKIISDIFETISSKTENTLLMVTGDHGMKDSGGHGGSTFSETHVPLVVIGHTCDNSSFLQTDIPVNLAILLGLQIPSLAVGKINKKLLQLNINEYLYALHYNSIILKQKDSCCNDLYDKAVNNYAEYILYLDQTKAVKAVELYELYLDRVSNNLAQVSVKQNLYSLCIALFVMINLLIVMIIDMHSQKTNNFFSNINIMACIILVQFIIQDSLILFTVMLVVLSFILFKNLRLLIFLKWKISINIFIFFVIVSFLHPITFISSSYVEEEHQYWYSVNILFIFFQFLYFSKTKQYINIMISLIFLSSFRFIRRMNSTGDKWATYPDLSDWFLKEENYFFYQLLFVVALLLVFLTQYLIIKQGRLTVHLVNLLTIILIFVFKQNETSIFLGRFIWFLIIIQFIWTYKISKTITWALVASLLLKPYNVILVPYCIFSSRFFSKRLIKPESLVLYHSLLGNVLYFAQGHSNSLASVDISVGYIGLSEYQPVLVIGQVLCHIQAFPVLCHLLLSDIKYSRRKVTWNVLFCEKFYVFFITCIVTFIFRHHLFIWSVFAPKLFIEFVHVLFLLLEYLLVEGGYFLVSLSETVKCKLKTVIIF